MGSWRDRILKEFTPQVARLTIVADPDGLLLEEGILSGIRERGFELIPFEDRIAFRYAYESNFRSRWDLGEQTDLVVVLRAHTGDLDSLPFDLLEAGRKLSFNLGDIFPGLSYPVLISLNKTELDLLYAAQERHSPGELGENASKEFVLRHVYGIAPELITQPSDLLRVLLKRHYRCQQIPMILDDRLIQILAQNEEFEEWPLDVIVPDRECFLSFLQERWPLFLDNVASPGQVKENKTPYGLKYSGPSILPFDHDDIRIYIDNLFVEGMLEPVDHESSNKLAEKWMGIGIRIDPLQDKQKRTEKLITNVKERIPGDDARHADWFLFARTWAELTATVYQSPIDKSAMEQIKGLFKSIDSSFIKWIENKYASLVNLPPVPPVMVHHIPKFIANKIFQDKSHKFALILVDGLALDQWHVIREEISPRRPGLIFRENAAFAWVPTLTSISRQAVFSGKPPVYFPNSIFTTDKEPSLWTQFWNDRGLHQSEIGYAKGLGSENVSEIENMLTNKTRVLGLVISKFDKIMHGMELGMEGMHNQVKLWAQQGYLTALIDLLIEKEFIIVLTSDHGNIEAQGCGRPTEGSIAELRGERVRIYSDKGLRQSVKQNFDEALYWDSTGLPNNIFPLIAPSRKAFVLKNNVIVTHGGISVEELIVPVVQIERKLI